MTVHQIHGIVPTWDTADRLRRALRTADLGVADMAERLDVSPNTVSRWINGRNAPDSRTIQLWAYHTGVDEGWIRNGSGGTGQPQGYAARESNPQPADLGEVVRFPPTRPSLFEAVAA